MCPASKEGNCQIKKQSLNFSLFLAFCFRIFATKQGRQKSFDFWQQVTTFDSNIAPGEFICPKTIYSFSLLEYGRCFGAKKHPKLEACFGYLLLNVLNAHRVSRDGNGSL